MWIPWEGLWQGDKVGGFSAFHTQTHLRALPPEAHGRGAHQRRERGHRRKEHIYGTVYTHCTDTHTASLAVFQNYPLGFSRQHYMGPLHTKDRAVSAMQEAEQPFSSFLRN